MIMPRRILVLLIATCTLLVIASQVHAVCPVVQGTQHLPMIEGLRARRVSDGIQVQWTQPKSLGTSTHVLVQVQADGECQGHTVQHDSHSTQITLDDAPGQDVVISASLVDGDSHLSEPVTITLTRWQKTSGYVKQKDAKPGPIATPSPYTRRNNPLDDEPVITPEPTDETHPHCH